MRAEGTAGPKALWIGFLICLLVVAVTRLTPLPEHLDLVLYDAQVAWMRELGPQAVDERIVVVGVDEATFAAYPEPFALWHRHFGDFLHLMAVVEPSVVGFDIAFPDRSFNSVMHGADQALLGGLLAVRGRVPVVLGITLDARGSPRRVYPPYLSLAGKSGQGFVVLPVDRDRVARRFTPDHGDAEQKASTLTGAMLRATGINPRAGMINYLLGGPFDYLRFSDLVQAYRDGQIDALRERLSDKYVLVGSVLPFEDRHLQPVNLAAWEADNGNVVPGMTIHAQALRSVVADRMVQTVPVTWTLGGVVLLLLLWWWRQRAVQAAAVFMLIGIAVVVLQSWQLRQDTYLPVALWLIVAAFAIGGRLTLDAGFQVLERRRLRAAFSGYVSPTVMEEILSGHLEPGVHGERRRLAVLFSDIRGFTTLSENMAPEEVIVFLNRYLAEMTEAIQVHGGTIDKFMGDGIMAFFGAPKDLEDPAAMAFAAAREKLLRLDGLNQTFAEEGSTVSLRIGIGLHLGEAVVGNIGSSERNEYTAIGDVVNTASRLEGLTKTAGYPVVLSEQMAKALGPDVPLADIGELPVKGRAPVHVYGWPAEGERS